MSDAVSKSAARRRFGSADDAGLDAEGHRRALCAAVFDDPRRITNALSHGVSGRFEIESHHHSDLLQLDLVHACDGTAIVDGQPVEIEGTTLLAAAPGQMHGYSLRPAGPDAAVWLVKLRVGRLDGEHLPGVVTGLGGLTTLRTAMTEFVRGWTLQNVSLVALTKLATVLSLWPSSAFDAELSPPARAESVTGDGPSARIRRAIDKLGGRVQNPPDLAELAAEANLSPRHFTRRFRHEFGCTPHDYLQARRLEVARGLLRDADRRVAGVADELGFSSPAAFSRWFTRLTGHSPRAFCKDPHNF